MRTRKWNPVLSALMGVACLGAVAVPASAVINCNWQACNSGITDEIFDFGWCGGAWTTPNNWDCGGASPPDASGDIAIITETTTGAAGGLSCPVTADAISALKIRAATKTFHSLRIKADSTAGADRLRIFFYGASTLTVNNTVLIDGVNGEVIIEMIDGATLQTN